jgi:hypothetical protein
MDYPAPKNIDSLIFNSNDFFDPNKTIVASGDQRIDGDITQNSEYLYGDQTVGGMLYVSSEPLITGNVNTLTLTDNNLVSKKYVDDEITASTTTIENLIPNATTFFFGRGYVSLGSGYSTYPTPIIENNYVQIDFVNQSLLVQSLVVDIVYQITESRANTTQIYKNTQYTAQYLLSFYKFTADLFVGASYQLLSGSSLTGNINDFNITPLAFGVFQNKPCINFYFPTNRNPNLKTSNYISNYGISMTLKSSMPLNKTNGLLALSSTNQNAFFLLH